MFRRIGFSVLRIAIGVGVGLLIMNYYSGWVLKNAVGNEYFTVKNQSSHFIVYGTAGSEKAVSEYSLFLEGFLEYLKQEYMDFKYDFPIKVYIWPNEDSFYEISKKAKLEGALGFFSDKTKAFYTFNGAGYGTLTHELMHPLMQANLPNQPKWTEEGIPTFFEKFFGYWEGGKLYIDTGYQNPWRIQALGADLTSLKLKEIVERPSSNQNELRLASVFLAENGLLKEYLQLIRLKDKRGFHTYYEAAFQKDFNGIEPYWREYLNGIALHGGTISRIPASQVFQSKKDYEAFARMYNLKELHKY